MYILEMPKRYPLHGHCPNIFGHPASPHLSPALFCMSLKLPGILPVVFFFAHGKLDKMFRLLKIFTILTPDFRFLIKSLPEIFQTNQWQVVSDADGTEKDKPINFLSQHTHKNKHKSGSMCQEQTHPKPMDLVKCCQRTSLFVAGKRKTESSFFCSSLKK